MGDAGLTGRKIIIDTYGGWGAHGGGAFSGKDPTKVDRSGAYACRWIAKSLVAAGLCQRVLVQVSYAIGVAQPLSIFVDTYGTGKVSDGDILAIVNKNFDLRPGCIIRDLQLTRPVFEKTATKKVIFSNKMVIVVAPFRFFDSIFLFNNGSKF